MADTAAVSAPAVPSAPETGAAADITAVAPVPIADLPSGDPIPTSAPSSKQPKPLPIKSLITALPSNVDALVSRLEKCLSTPSGIDTVMLFLGYTSKLSASILTTLSASALQRSARDWLTVLTSLPRGTTLVLSTPSKPPTSAALALLVAKRLNALSALMSEARTILRLWALLGIYSWARGLIRKTFSAKSEKDEKAAASSSKSATLLEYVRVLLCIALQGLENGAYLSYKGVLGWTPEQQGKAYKWSSRFWAAFVGIEIGRLAAQRFASKEGVKTAEEKSSWNKSMAKSLAWAPLTVHWSTDKGLVSDGAVGLLASIPGIIQMTDLWRNSAKA
ncbi:putative peroxin 11c protein [Cladorrhinum samala]|uniref:Peroxin 11c protein n=1 Tax=Cladorrhinum samala TaxID=585594 RepID=A0AAV9H9Z8_9PEZI|nr:putative peroxin 11c protein [Cladorrhinum samala]